MRTYFLIDKETGKTIKLSGVSTSMIYGETFEKEYENLAWNTAVDDGLVDKNSRDKYRFEFND